jgi:hypothetical protein
MNKTLLHGVLAFLMFSSMAFAQEQVVTLPAPRTEGGKPLMECLKERKTQREFSSKPLPQQLMSDLLWSANGVNRTDGKRTAPTAMDMREIDVYVVKEDAVFFYDPEKNTLTRVLSTDIRQATGYQDFVLDAPVNLVFVVDESRMHMSASDKSRYAYADTGYISQNIYLFCASEGLATVVRGAFDQQQLAAAMKLKPNQKAVLCQTVGYPK